MTNGRGEGPVASRDQAYFASGFAAEEERQRLRLLEAELDPISFRHLTLLGFADRAEPLRVIDVGAGGGSVVRWLAAHAPAGSRVTAADTDTRFVADIDDPCGRGRRARHHDRRTRDADLRPRALPRPAHARVGPRGGPAADGRRGRAGWRPVGRGVGVRHDPTGRRVGSEGRDRRPGAPGGCSTSPSGSASTSISAAGFPNWSRQPA